MNIYVGNLSVAITESKLLEMFSNYGIVNSVKVIIDRYTNLPRGFAFVEMAARNDGEQAVTDLHETHLDARFITVSEARPRSERTDNYNDRY